MRMRILLKKAVKALYFFIPFFSLPLFAEDILAAKELVETKYKNEEIHALREKLRKKYEEAGSSRAVESDSRQLLEQINQIKKEILAKEEEFRKAFLKDNEGSTEAYALWDQGETTLSQLLMEYGSSDYLYVIPQELSSLKLYLHSSIGIPRESWSEMIDLILKGNGIGVKKINPFTKQLYVLKHDLSIIELIADKKEDLQLVEPSARVFFAFSSDPEQARPLQSFFERFSDPRETSVHVVGSKVLIVSSRESIEKLLSIHAAVWEKNGGKTVRVVNLKKIQVIEAEKILKAFFPDPNSKTRPSFYPQIGDEMVVMALPQGLVLVGEASAIERAEKILFDLENQLDDPSELIIFWYTCKHSDPADLAEVLEKIYESLSHTDLVKKEGESKPAPLLPEKNSQLPGASLPVSPSFVQAGTAQPKGKDSRTNFMVDPKTGSLLMVIRKEELSKIKALLKKLDVPKKMVQIDVLLVEKKLQDRKQTGINLLKIGGTVKKKETAISFDTNPRGARKGIFDFLFSRDKSSSLPAIDLTYSFLLALDDMRINANPSVIAINQTPASISIVEEISINNGASLLEAGNGVTVEKSFTRAQYGTTLVMTPTIHLPDPEDEEGEEKGFITLVTNVTFDTTETSTDDRPPVTRRHIENEVRVADGETIILGGLRRKSSENKNEKVPFLGEIPGIGKLFGMTNHVDNNTEMFIFITPKIIHDPVEDLRHIRSQQLQKRAGDIPEFVQKLEEAKVLEKKELFEDSLKLVFDRWERQK
jgi:general secretion pathway protein D